MPTFKVVVAPAHTSADSELTRERLYFLDGAHLGASDVRDLAERLLADPVTERYELDPPQTPNTIEITFLPGVTDSAAESLLHAAHVCGHAAVERAASGTRVSARTTRSVDELEALARDRFANTVIQRFAVNQSISAPFVHDSMAHADDVELIALDGLDDDGLLALSRRRRLSLDLSEMRAVQAYYEAEGRAATDVELEMLAQTWSEHCVHKTFRALIDVQGEADAARRVDGLLRTYIRAATEALNKPWVKSAFVDNAGVIAFDEAWDLAFKVETHNHPSALEPFGGANTGVGGVIRDVLGVSAKPIAVTDVLCFGPLDLPHPPAGVLHPRRVFDGVVAGVEDYGNKMGIPTVNGAVYFHPGFTANPLVFAGCLGVRPASTPSAPGKPAPGDLIVAMGGRTGRDGLRGATFSSMEMDVETSDIAGSAVQIGHPIREKQTQEALLQAHARGLYRALTDCGAGGFSSAVGEMASGLGARVQLKQAPLKYPGLKPWEIWLSEAQERMVLAVPAKHLPELEAVCAGQDVEVVVLGDFEDSGRVRLFSGERLVGDLSVAFLHDGIPQRKLTADVSGRNAKDTGGNAGNRPEAKTFTTAVLSLLKHPNIRSKEDVIRLFDHEVKGQTAVKPLVGAANHGPGDAAVLVPDPRSSRGVALSNGLCPQFTEHGAYAMAFAAVDEAVRNAVAVGADPDYIAILDNFCWGNPNLPDRLGSLVEAARGCHDAALAYGAPFISGKDSLNNEFTGADGAKHAIPGTLLISAVGIVPDVARTVTMDLKRPGDVLYVVGLTRDELAGSHYRAIFGAEADGVSPQPAASPLVLMRALHRAIAAGLVAACHDCSEGGLAVALAEMSLAGRLGATVDLAAMPVTQQLAAEAKLFAESIGRFVVEVAPEHAAEFEAHLSGVAHARVGEVTGARNLVITDAGGALVDADIEALEVAFRGAPAPVLSLPVRGAQASYAAAPVTEKRVLILHANGSNRDHDAALAIELAGGQPEIVHINRLFTGERVLADYHMLVVPGGFSYGDDLGAGVMWSLDLRERLGAQLDAFVKSGRPVLGICNGFQTLVKAGLLPGSQSRERAVTLTYNAHGHFECRWVVLDVNPNSASLFTKGLTEPIYCPVAHGEGRFLARDALVLAALERRGLVALRYRGEGYPHNPNGSAANIAGICNDAGNVLGLMPHPENHVFSWQHPGWRRGEGGGSGLALFRNGITNA